MYCTGGIRCERGSAYLKAKVSHHPWGPAGMAVNKASPTAFVELSPPYLHPFSSPSQPGVYCPLIWFQLRVCKYKIRSS